METTKKPRRVGDGTPGPGRPKGSQNKVTRSVMEVIESVAHGLGGAERMLAWARENPRNEDAFWERIYPKLLPLTVRGDKSAPLGVVLIPPKDA